MSKAWHAYFPVVVFFKATQLINMFFSALGGQRGQKENEQKQCKSPQYTASEDPQVQQGLRVRNYCLQGGK